MHCKGCALGLAAALEHLPQVRSANALFPQQTATVQWEGEEAYEPVLRAATEEAGFEVVSFQ